MRITNWLNAFTSRLHFRPRYNSRARRAMRRRMHQRSYLNPPALIELLEVRQMLTSTLFLDFGAGFTGGELHTTVEDYLEIDGTGTGDGTGPDLVGYGSGSSFLGLSDDLVFKSLDYDFDGNSTVNTADLTALANAVVSHIERALEPFDIDVVIASANDFSDVQTSMGLNDLDSSGEFDAYVFVTEIWSKVFGTGGPGSLGSVGATTGLYGIAAASDLFTTSSGLYQQGNQYDEAAHTFIDTIFDATSGTSGTAAFNANLSQRLAYTATHEAFHTFSLIHTDSGNALDNGDVIELGSVTREDPFMVTRFDLNRQKDDQSPPVEIPVTQKNNYLQIANDSDIGLRDDNNNNTPDLAYVTGTGAHDQISLAVTGTDTVTVTIKAYSDSARTTQIGSTYSYNIDLTSDTDGEILIDAGIGDDEIIIDASIEASFRVRGNIGDDTLIVDVSDGLAASLGNIAFDAEGDGGSILLDQGSNGSSFTTVAHTLSSNTAGTISVDGQTITYTNTTSVSDELDTTNRSFSFTGAAETITLSDTGTGSDTLSLIDSTLGTAVTFVSTASAVTVSTNSGSGADQLNLQGLDNLNASDFTITGDTDDNVTFQTNATAMAANDLSITAQTITVSQTLSSTTGALSLNASRNIVLNSGSSLTTVDGGITLQANNLGTTAGTFIGIDVNNATIQSTGTGNISLTAIGGDREGIYLHDSTAVSSTASGSSAGTISLDGTGGDASTEQHGVLLIDTTLTSVDGNITVNGQGGGDGTGNNNVGLYLRDTGISSTGTGSNAATITLDGTGGDGVSINRGIRAYDLTMTSVDGGITIIGEGEGTGAGNSNEGIVLGGTTTSITSTGAGANAADIIITGAAGAGATYNQGVYVAANLAVTSNAGDIFVFATGNILLDTSSDIQSTSGDILVLTTYLNSDNTGRLTVNGGTISSAGLVSVTTSSNILLNSGSSVTTVNGGITLQANSLGTTAGTFIGIEANHATIQTTGTGNIALTAIGENREGIYLYGNTAVSSTASGASAGTISLNGTAGEASTEQHGILLISTSIASVDGNISLTGQGGGDGTGNNNVGLYLRDTGISSTGTGSNAATITLDGTGGDGVSINRGIRTYNLTMTSVDGDITIIGEGEGTGAGNSNEGIVLGGTTTSITSTGAGADAADISITGDAGAGATYNQGVSVAANLAVTSNAGDISVTTEGDILLDTSSDLQSTSGDIQITTTYLNSDNTGRLTVNGGTISSAGLVSANTSSNILLTSGSSVTTVNGGVTLQANSLGTTAGTFIGIEANHATIQSTGTGNIALTAIGENREGIYLYGNSVVSSTASGASAGTISLNGTAGDASTEQHGVLLISTSIASVDGNISLTGQGGGDGTGNNNVGLYLYSSSISSTGTGANAATITVEGTGGDGVSINRGIRTYNLTMTSVDGDTTIIGEGEGTGAGNSNEGVVLSGTSTNIESTGTGAYAAEITIEGAAGSGLTYNQGVYVSSQVSIISDVADISITSDGDALFDTSSDIETSSGDIVIIVNYLSASNVGILTMNAGTLFDAGSGNIDLDVDDDVLLAGLTTTGTVTIDSANGSILDNDDTDLDIVADTGILTAAGSIGLSGNLLDTSMGSYTPLSGISDVNIYNI